MRNDHKVTAWQPTAWPVSNQLKFSWEDIFELQKLSSIGHEQHNCEVLANQGVGLIKTLGSWREAETRYYMFVKKLEKPGPTPSEIARDAPYP